MPGQGHQGVSSAGFDDMLAKFVTKTVTPASVGAAVSAEQAVTVPGAAPGDVVLVAPAATGNATSVGGIARVSAANTVQVPYVNTTAGALTPGAGSYTFIILRKPSRA